MAEDAYIVRIYRREAGRDAALVGVVEEVKGRRRHAFHNADELWSVLTGLERRGPAQAKGMPREK